MQLAELFENHRNEISSDNKERMFDGKQIEKRNSLKERFSESKLP